MLSVESRYAGSQSENLFIMLLRGGIVAAVLLAIGGGSLYLLRHGASISHFQAFQGEPAELRAPGTILHAAMSWHSGAIIQLGILLLILTPVLRVIMALVSFARQRDYLYIGVGLTVLGILLFNMLGGAR